MSRSPETSASAWRLAFGRIERRLRALSGGAPPDAYGDEDDVPAPLVEVARIFGLSELERDVLLLATAAECDPRYARIFFELEHVARPTVGIALAVLAAEVGAAGPTVLDRFHADATLRRHALIALEGDGPLPTRTIRVPEDVWPRLVGIDRPPPFPVARPGATLTRTSSTDIAEIAELLTRDGGVVLVEGRPGSGRGSTALAVAARAGRATVCVDTRAEPLDGARAARVTREAVWNDAIVFIDGPSPSAPTLARLLESVAAVIVVEDPDGAAPVAATAAGRPLARIVVDVPDDATRARWWRDALGDDLVGDGATDVARGFRFGPDRIRAAVHVARSLAARRGARITEADLGQACRISSRSPFSTLAHRLPAVLDRHDLVVPRSTWAEIDLAIAWVRHAGRVARSTPIGARTQAPGLAALFHGPPGTGKTMAAQIVGRELGLDVWRVDLAQLVSKYIGETEKNLGRVFDEAEAANCVLFFDEADALFARRTDVRDAHDRYANVETGFLLQRLESHPGITILASNLRTNVDPAFMRRIHVFAEFPMPGVTERRAIWELHLPPAEARDGDVDLDDVAARFTLSGGDIRNASFAAGLMAAAEGGPVSTRHLALAIYRQMRNDGRIVDPSAFGAMRDVVAAHATSLRGAPTPART